MGLCPGLKFGSHSVSGFAGATDGRVAGAGGEVTVASVAFMWVQRKDLRAGVVVRLLERLGLVFELIAATIFRGYTPLKVGLRTQSALGSSSSRRETGAQVPRTG